jgi:hypothetical protein
VAVGTAVGVSVTVAGAVAVAVCVAVDVYVTVTGGDGVGDTDGAGDAVNVAVVADGLGPWAPDRVAACAAVPVNAIAAAPSARQPDAKLMRIAISRSCSPGRSGPVLSGNGSDGDRSAT